MENFKFNVFFGHLFCFFLLLCAPFGIEIILGGNLVKLFYSQVDRLENSHTHTHATHRPTHAHIQTTTIFH